MSKAEEWWSDWTRDDASIITIEDIKKAIEKLEKEDFKPTIYPSWYRHLFFEDDKYDGQL